MAKIVAVMNKKGGVGKTSTVHHLGGTLARRGLKVVLADVDGQGNLSAGLLGPEVVEALDPMETIAAILDDSGAVSPRDLVRPTAYPNLFIIPGSKAIDPYNVPEPWETGLRQFILREALIEAGQGADYLLIDCPPHVQYWAWSALVAADGVIVPVQPEDYGAQGLRAIRQTIAHVRADSNPSLALIGYLISMFNKSMGVHVTYSQYLNELHGADVFATVIPAAADLKESVTLRKPICDHKPKSAAAKAYAALADEFLVRIEARTGRDADQAGRAA